VRHAVAVVLAIDCQARVAMLVSGRRLAPALEAAVLDVLDNGLVRNATLSNQSDAIQ